MVDDRVKITDDGSRKEFSMVQDALEDFANGRDDDDGEERNALRLLIGGRDGVEALHGRLVGIDAVQPTM